MSGAFESIDARWLDRGPIAQREFLVQMREVRERAHHANAINAELVTQQTLIEQRRDVIEAGFEDRFTMQCREHARAAMLAKLRQLFMCKVDVEFVRREIDIGEDGRLQRWLLEDLAAPSGQLTRIQHFPQLVAKLFKDANSVAKVLARSVIGVVVDV